MAIGAVSLLAAVIASPGRADDDPPVEPVPFSACGVIEQSADDFNCFSFVTHNGRFIVESLGDFAHGDSVCITGDLVPAPCEIECGEEGTITGCVFNSQVDEAIEQFGTFMPGPSCKLLQTANGETFQLRGLLPHDVEPGDPINVIGRLAPTCHSVCEVPCIDDPEITAGSKSTGTVVDDGSCLSVRADSGESLLLENTGGFAPGDRVFVTGRISLESSICPPVQGPGLEDNTIAGLFEGCGLVLEGPGGCRTLAALNQNLLLDDVDVPLNALVRVVGVIEPEMDRCIQAGVGVRPLSIVACVK
ncbi:MAG: hypothetical protein ACYTGC_12740, partial [Planctomycetota bacterium]